MNWLDSTIYTNFYNVNFALRVELCIAITIVLLLVLLVMQLQGIDQLKFNYDS